MIVAQGRPRGSSQNRGITLLELVIAVSILSVALLALMSSVITSTSLQATSREKVIAYNAARQVIEQMRSTPNFSDIYKNYNAASNPNQNTFNVGEFKTLDGTTGIQWINNDLGVKGTGLQPMPGVPVGQIFFPSDANLLLREDFYTIDQSPNKEIATVLGMGPLGKDLNRDGTIDSNDHSLDYKILPVLVRIQWQSAGKRPMKIDVATFITVD
ncbi:MAG TPA: type II secretion system protein [Planctomycetota bacterium]|nr:type II secretion system protein [Planctomycetota bacterium]